MKNVSFPWILQILVVFGSFISLVKCSGIIDEKSLVQAVVGGGDKGPKVDHGHKAHPGPEVAPAAAAPPSEEPEGRAFHAGAKEGELNAGELSRGLSNTKRKASGTAPKVPATKQKKKAGAKKTGAGGAKTEDEESVAEPEMDSVEQLTAVLNKYKGRAFDAQNADDDDEVEQEDEDGDINDEDGEDSIERLQSDLKKYARGKGRGAKVNGKGGLNRELKKINLKLDALLRGQVEVSKLLKLSLKRMKNN